MAGRVLADSVQFQAGDVLAAVGDGLIRHYDPEGNLLQTLDTTSGSYFTTGMCFDQTGNLFVTNFDGESITRFNHHGELLVHPWGGPLEEAPESCVVAQDGSVYVGLDVAEQIWKYDADGTRLMIFEPDVEFDGTKWIDLASDQCTMLYTDGSLAVKRFDVCAGTQLPDFAELTDFSIHPLRIHPSGDIFVVTSLTVERFSQEGNLLQIYSRYDYPGFGSFFPLALDPNQTSFWVGDPFEDSVFKIDIETGELLTEFTVSTETALTGLRVYGEDLDCNTNGMADPCDTDCGEPGGTCDIPGCGTSEDCPDGGPGNGIPDECEADCNGNGIADACDLANGTSMDCTADGIPDECDADCNSNGVPDSCDIGAGTSADCTSNGVPDECEPDCNTNGAPDSCDIADGLAEDCNLNAVPDVCDVAAGTSTDLNGNITPDECEFLCAFTTELFDDDGGTGDNFGFAVDLDGDAVIVGAYDETTGGVAYFFRFDDGAWVEQAKLQASDQEYGDDFGRSVAVYGNLAVVGAPYHDATGQLDSGAAYVFEYDGVVWTEVQKLVPSDVDYWMRFGHSISISDEAIIVGAPDADGSGSSSGAAYVFRADGSGWTEEQKLAAGTNWDDFGSGVAIDGEVVLIGAEEDDTAFGSSAGSAYIFRFDGSVWIEEQYLLPSAGNGNARFGGNVTLAADVAIIGAKGDNSDITAAGAVYVFRLDGTSWEQDQKLVPTDVPSLAYFGKSVDLSDDLLVIGTPRDDDQGETSGSAFVFQFEGSSFVQVQKLLAPDGKQADLFGTSVAISGTTAIAGAYLHNSDFLDTGSAYVFVDPLDGDCNDNGTTDFCDIAFGISVDEDDDGLPDECEQPCEGDPNGDGLVDPLDAGFVLARFGCPVGTGDPNCDIADQNDDGLVDPLDVGFVLARFGECP